MAQAGDKLELLLTESLRVTHASGALRGKTLARVTVDTTVQQMNIAVPTNAKLLQAAIKGLNRLAKKDRLKLRQSHLRLAKHGAMMAAADTAFVNDGSVWQFCFDVVAN